MPKIVYYVACSIDGFIAGKNDDVSNFIFQGEGVDKYQQDLKQFQTVIMGRRTYEIGYQYGLKPGQPAYQGMEHYIFSDSLQIDDLSNSVHIETRSLDRVKKIKENSKTDVYLCGGGEFAGWLQKHRLIDQLKLKINPIILGEGIRLFGSYTTPTKWRLVEQESFSDGLLILTYDLL